jgi:photosystem II stability/assembly factor-like uncharacterized protein
MTGTLLLLLFGWMIQQAVHDPTWKKLATVPYPGKQDDVAFASATRGWYVNGSGRIYRTADAGMTWTEQVHKPGTYFRAIGAVNDSLVFAGNIGTDYFPDVSDTIPLYRSRDGGSTWLPVTGIRGPAVKGICAIDVLHSQFVNAGTLSRRTVIHAGGRVGGPAYLLRSLDGGESWTSLDVSAHTAMILDVKFFSENEGLIMGATSADVATSRALILRTIDGGRSWQRVYEGQRPFELTWKGSFPSRLVGYVTIQSYDPDTTQAQRVVAKTTDGGRTWTEVPLVRNHRIRQFGVGFVDERVGWVGTNAGGYETRDGGTSWRFVDMGRAVNKIRPVAAGAGVEVYAIGVDLYKLTWTPGQP